MAAEDSEHRHACMCTEHDCIRCVRWELFGAGAALSTATAVSADCERVHKENDTDETQTQPDDEQWHSAPHCDTTMLSSTLSTAGDSGSAASWSSRSRRRRNTSSTVAHRLHTALSHCSGDRSNTAAMTTSSWSSSLQPADYLRSERGCPRSTKSEPARQRSAESVYCDERLQAHSWGGSEYMHKDKGHRRRTSTDTPPCPKAKCACVQCASGAVRSSTSASSCYSHSGNTSGTSSGSLAVCAAEAAAAMLLSVESVVADVRSVHRLCQRNGESVGELSDAMRTFFTTVATATAAGTEHKHSQ